jgi:hypothetical protein
MEDVLAVYERRYEASFPVVCLDEGSKQLLSEAREPIAAKPGQVQRQDNEYVRGGTASLFMAFEPLAGKREVFVRERRTAIDFAKVVRHLLEETYKEAERVVLVLDNLNTHGPHSLYAAFPPAVARGLCERIEWHFTPKHGSWLNMAEIELSVLSRQCLSERMGSLESLERQVGAWQQRRNAAKCVVDWQFSIADARQKLKRLYPQLLTG